MIQDYSQRYSAGGGRRQNVYRRGDRGPAGEGFLWKAVGVLVSLAVVVGVAASLWLGWQIDSGLDELAAGRRLQAEAMARNTLLLSRRDELRRREHVEAAAGGLGLYPPTPQQIRRP